MGFESILRTLEVYCRVSPYITPSQGTVSQCVVVLLCVLSKLKTHMSKGKGIDAFQSIGVGFIEFCD